jgi:hypothetical protein
MPGDEILGDTWWVLWGLTGQNRLAVKRMIEGGFSSKRYRKGTCLVQVYPVNGWIWCSWNECQNAKCQTKPLTTVRWA